MNKQEILSIIKEDHRNCSISIFSFKEYYVLVYFDSFNDNKWTHEAYDKKLGRSYFVNGKCFINNICNTLNMTHRNKDLHQMVDVIHFLYKLEKLNSFQ